MILDFNDDVQGTTPTQWHQIRPHNSKDLLLYQSVDLLKHNEEKKSWFAPGLELLKKNATIDVQSEMLSAATPRAGTYWGLK